MRKYNYKKKSNTIQAKTAQISPLHNNATTQIQLHQYPKYKWTNIIHSIKHSNYFSVLMGKSIFSISHGKTPCWFYVIYNSTDYFLGQDFCFGSYSELSESWRRGGARPRRGSRGELQGSLGFQENCHPRDCEQVEIGHKGTKEGVGYLPILFTAFRVIIRSAGCWGRTNILDKRRITREKKY